MKPITHAENYFTGLDKDVKQQSHQPDTKNPRPRNAGDEGMFPQFVDQTDMWRRLNTLHNSGESVKAAMIALAALGQFDALLVLAEPLMWNRFLLKAGTPYTNGISRIEILSVGNDNAVIKLNGARSVMAIDDLVDLMNEGRYRESKELSPKTLTALRIILTPILGILVTTVVIKWIINKRKTLQ